MTKNKVAFFSGTLCISLYLRHLMRKSCDLDLEHFKVVKDHGAN